jgi:NADPH-dependent curcumin reductase CurA
MNDIKLNRIVLAARPQGAVQPGDFRFEEAEMPKPGPGEMLLKVQYLSLDPYMRGRMDDRKSYAASTELGAVMPGESIASVLDSNHPGYHAGDIVLAQTGWQTHAISDGSGRTRKIDPALAPVTARLGVLGMPGFSAYSGLKVIGRPAKGETVVVAAASGPVGSLVGQLARLGGARAIGIAGGSAKCRFVKEELGFDEAIDHREQDFASRLAAACPAGIDVYFENVGGAVWDAVLPLLNRSARVPVCGLIAQYTAPPPESKTDRLATAMRAILSNRITIQGFINYDFENEHYDDFLRNISRGIADGTIRYREDVVEGLEKAPEAFIGMLAGRNFGKVLVRIAG